MEYGCCGLSEEDAIKLYGEENIDTYLFEFGTLEHQVGLCVGISLACTRRGFSTDVVYVVEYSIPVSGRFSSVKVTVRMKRLRTVSD